MRSMECCSTEEQPLNGMAVPKVNIPGKSWRAIIALPLRLFLTLLVWTLTCPMMILISVLRALWLRIVKGRPSQILKYGTHNAEHIPGMHYPCMQLYTEPLDEGRLRKALVELLAEDGVEEKDIYLKFNADEPKDWPQTGSFNLAHFTGTDYWQFDAAKKDRGETEEVKLRIHVWNGKSGKPTVMYYYGSGTKWDGSSNFNFVKELISRYMGNPPREVFQKPQITDEAAALFDQSWFLYFLLKMPFVIATNYFMMLWNFVRAAKWAGGNGIGPRSTAMNFNKEESDKLYTTAKKLGVKPFALFTYAAVKACKEVLGEAPISITQQASLQTRHYPLEGLQEHRDLVGDWLVGPEQAIPRNYGVKEAMEGYKELSKELDEVGPMMRSAIMAKAYGILNSGAAAFQWLPTYAAWYTPTDRQLFMNNYGVRTMPEGSPFHTWNWNAPFWFGLNTINVDGRTTTLVGSMIFGMEVVEAMRDSTEATLREFMAQAGSNMESVPSYTPVMSSRSMGAEKSMASVKTIVG